MTTSICIETPRLILRTVTMDDIDAVAASWELDAGPISRTEAEAKVAWMHANHQQHTPGRIVHLCLVIVHKEAGAFIGWCGLDHRKADQPNPVLFYVLKEPYWGKGLATEAASALLEYAFCGLGLLQIDSAAAYENVASKRVMEKIGMQSQGLDDEGGYFFTLSRDAWRALSAHT